MTLADSNFLLFPTLLFLGGWFALTAVLVPWLMARARLRAGALRNLEALAAGKTDRRADPTAPGEAGRIGRAVNQLAVAQAHLKEQHDQFRDNLYALLDHTNEVVLATNEEDLVQMVSPAAARMLDRPASAVMGRPITDLFAQRDILDLYRSAGVSGKPVSADLRLSVARHEILCHAVATPMHAGSRYRGTLLLLRDLTEIMQATQMKTDFASNASHELRTPLASIRAAVETIHDSWNDLHEPDPDIQEAASTTIRRCVDIVGSHVLRLELMVQDLLDLSRTEDPRAVVRTDRVDLAAIADTVTAMYNGFATDKKIRLHVTLADDARSLRGDERLLLLILKNLVDNALKFTPAGGEVRVWSQHFSRQDAGHAEQAFVLAVTDTGIGIPKEDQQRVFERFYTVNRSRGGADRGTGLGLAIVKHAVAAMAGTVTLESEVNKGTTVRCTFPVRNPAPLPSPDPTLA